MFYAHGINLLEGFFLVYFSSTEHGSEWTHHGSDSNPGRTDFFFFAAVCSGHYKLIVMNAGVKWTVIMENGRGHWSYCE